MEGERMREGEEEIRIGVYVRGSPARASPFPVAAISLMLPRSASIAVLKDEVATQHAASARQQPFSLIDPFALIRSAKVIFGGLVLSDTTTLAQAGVQDGASLNLVLASSSPSAPSSPPPVVPHLASSSTSSTFTSSAPISSSTTSPLYPLPSSSSALQACYLSSLPRISELHPNVGLTSGGQRVLIVGTNFSRNCTCRFGPVRNLPLKYHRQVRVSCRVSCVACVVSCGVCRVVCRVWRVCRFLQRWPYSARSCWR